MDIRPELLPYTPLVDHFRALSQPAVAMFIVMSGFVLGLPVALMLVPLARRFGCAPNDRGGFRAGPDPDIARRAASPL